MNVKYLEYSYTLLEEGYTYFDGKNIRMAVCCGYQSLMNAIYALLLEGLTEKEWPSGKILTAANDWDDIIKVFPTAYCQSAIFIPELWWLLHLYKIIDLFDKDVIYCVQTKDTFNAMSGTVKFLLDRIAIALVVVELYLVCLESNSWRPLRSHLDISEYPLPDENNNWVYYSLDYPQGIMRN